MLELITGLFPPEQASEEQTRQWRRSISVVVIAIGAATVANTALTWGLVPVVFAGFATVASVDAMAGDFSQVQKQLTEQGQQASRDKDEIKAAILLGQLNQIFDAMCGAIRARRTEEANQWERQFTEKIIEYNRISGTVYPMRNCG